MGTKKGAKTVVLFSFYNMEANKRNIDVYLKRKEGKVRDNRNKPTPQSNGDNFMQRTNLLMSCYNAWSALGTWRDDIRRNEEFVYGDQHSDRVYDAKNKRYVTERQLFVEQGLQPSQYNIIRNILRTIVGVWGSNKTLPVCVAQKEENQAESDVLTATLHALYRKNELWKLDEAELLQLLLTGMMGTDNNYVNRDGDSDIVNDYIDPFAFFVDNSMKDPRYKDCTLVGFYVDMTVEDVVGAFSHGSKERAGIIRNLYRGAATDERIYSMTQTFTDERIEKDFFTPGVESYGMARVIKCWRKESAECFWVHDRLNGKYWADYSVTEAELKAVNVQRIMEQSAMGVSQENMLLLEWEWGTSSYWKYYFMTPFGYVLDSGVNPYWHEEPSIIFELHEFFVGKIYPFVKDVIDTQKQINKLSAISELLSKYSAKSLMFLPLDQLDENYGLDYIEKKITDFDAVIPYRPKAGSLQKPEFVSTIAQAFTPLNVVNMYLKLSENVSGVYGALQGSQPTAGTPAQMYAQQSQNSATSLTGIIDAVTSYRMRRDKMNVQLMQQFYKGKRWIYDQKSGKRILWDHDKVKNIEFEMSTVENKDTPAYRLMVNDLLFQLKQYDTSNMLDLRGLIEAGNLPFKEQLLNYLNKREEEMRNGGQPGQMPDNLQKQLGQYQFSPQLQAQFASLPPEVQQQVLNSSKQ